MQTYPHFYNCFVPKHLVFLGVAGVNQPTLNFPHTGLDLRCLPCIISELSLSICFPVSKIVFLLFCHSMSL